MERELVAAVEGWPEIFPVEVLGSPVARSSSPSVGVSVEVMVMYVIFTSGCDCQPNAPVPGFAPCSWGKGGGVAVAFPLLAVHNLGVCGPFFLQARALNLSNR